MAASTSCSALIGSAPWICARRRRERLAETLAPVGPQAPPAPSARCALDSASERRGALLWTTGTSGVRAHLSIMSPNTCPPCLRPLLPPKGGEGTDLDDLFLAQCRQLVLGKAEQLAINGIGIGPEQ